MSATALYKALVRVDVPEDQSEKAVEGLIFVSEAVTKEDVTVLKTDLIKLRGGV